MFDRILLPVDLTGKNEATVSSALELLTDSGTLTLLHVIETIADAPFEDMQDFYQRLEDKARSVMGSMTEILATQDVAVQTHVTYGRRAAEIVSFAQENSVDLIIMSSRNLDPDRPETAWASISHQVAVLAKCPVLLLK